MAVFRGSFFIFEGSFLHFGSEIAQSPRVFYPWFSGFSNKVHFKEMHRLNLSIDNNLKSFQVVVTVKLSFTWPAANVACIYCEFRIQYFFQDCSHSYLVTAVSVVSWTRYQPYYTWCIYKALDHTSHSMGQLNSICRKPQLATAWFN